MCSLKSTVTPPFHDARTLFSYIHPAPAMAYLGRLFHISMNASRYRSHTEVSVM